MHFQSDSLFLRLFLGFLLTVTRVLGEAKDGKISEYVHAAHEGQESPAPTLEKLQYEILLPHGILNPSYTTDESVNVNLDTNSKPLVQPANLLPAGIYNHMLAAADGSEEDLEEASRKTMHSSLPVIDPMPMAEQSPLTANPNFDSYDSVRTVETPAGRMSIEEMEKSLREEAAVLNLGGVEFDTKSDKETKLQFVFNPHLKSGLFPETETVEEIETLSEGGAEGRFERLKDFPAADQDFPAEEKQQLFEPETFETEGIQVENLPKKSAPKDKSTSDITLELNPNSSDLEFVHVNSSLKSLKSIPTFLGQISTLSFAGVKRPVLIIQPDVVRNKQANQKISTDKDNTNTTDANSDQVEDQNKSKETKNEPHKFPSSQSHSDTAIPNFSIHFPLQTNSQFQIPRFNFTLPTLFLPGLVFTQNENPETNTHEVHVSIPQTSQAPGYFPAAHENNPEVLELLPINPQDSVGNEPNQYHVSQPEASNSSVNLESAESHKENRTSNLKLESQPSQMMTQNSTTSDKIKEPEAQEINPDLYFLNVSAPRTSSVKMEQKIRRSPKLTDTPLEDLEKIHNNLFGAGRPNSECDGGPAERQRVAESATENEDDATLCGSDNLCGATCNRLGFFLGKCDTEEACVCLLKQRPEFGLRLDYYADKRVRSWETIYPVRGFCHTSSCRINCERAGYVIGFCEGSCFCGTPWAEKANRSK